MRGTIAQKMANNNEPIAVCRSVEDLQRALRIRADFLKIARDDLDEIAGLARGHAAKLLCDPPVKNLGPVSAFPMIGALGMAVVLIEDPSALARIKRHPHYRVRTETNVRNGKSHWRNAQGASIIETTFKKFGKLGALAFMEKVAPSRRIEIAKKAARARWRKRRKAA